MWAQVTRALRPLPSRAPADGPAPPVPRPPVPPPRSAPVATARKAAAVPQLDRRLRQRLARGLIRIDARIDLHGMSQAEAFAQLTAFLRRARSGGARIVLVITGKGAARGPGMAPRGVLRRQVPLWLSSAGLNEGVIAFAAAAPEHGGDGALYVRLRRLER